MCRQRISIRLSSGAYGIKYFIINPFFFHRAIYSSNASLLCMEALSITTTVFFLIFLQKSFKQATTTEVLKDCSKRYGYTSFFLFIKPKTFMRLPFVVGISMMLPASCQAYGIEGARVHPDSSK